MTPFSSHPPIVDRRSFLVRAALASGLFMLGAQPSLAETRRGNARFVMTVQGRRYGVRMSDMRGGRHLVTLRALEGRDRHAWSFPSRSNDSQGTLTFGGRSYTVSASGRSVRTDVPGVSIDPPEGDAPQTQIFRGLLLGIAAVITAIVGGEVEIETAKGSKLTIKSNGAGGSETASEGSGGAGEGGTGGGGESSYRAEPGMEDDPGVWY